MQSFQSKVQRIPGSRMGLADHMSRMYLEDADETVKEVIEDDITVITEMALHLFLLDTTSPDPNHHYRPLHRMAMHRKRMSMTIYEIVMEETSFTVVCGAHGSRSTRRTLVIESTSNRSATLLTSVPYAKRIATR